MNNVHLLRIGAAAAVSGAAAQLVASVLEVDASGDPAKAVRVVANTGFWNGDRLLDLLGVLLTVGALTVVGRAFAEGRETEWARAAQPFLVLMGALGAGAVFAGANTKELADAWVDAAPKAKPSYLAIFDASRNAADDLFFGAFLALGIYLALLAVAILAGRTYARWLGWASAASAALVLSGDLLELVVADAFLAVLAGFVLFLAMLIAFGVRLWRLAGSRGRAPASPMRTTGGATTTREQVRPATEGLAALEGQSK